MLNASSTRPAVAVSLAPVYSMVAPGGHNVDGVVMEGWVLKKRRKKMQGFARRYFVLHQSGVLSYSFEPGHPPRDQVLLPQAAISTAPGRRDIHVDSCNATFHIKCLSGQDFNDWMTAFRKYIASDSATIGRRSSTSKSLPRNGHYNRAGVLVDEIGHTISELQAAFAALVEEEGKRKVAASSKSRDHAREHAGPVLSLFKHRKSSTNVPHVHAPHHDTTVPSENGEGSRSSESTPIYRLQNALESLKFQHSALVQSFPAHSHLEGSGILRTSPLPTAREDEEIPTPESAFSTLGRSSHRLSSQSEVSVWYDAEEYGGAEEFVLDDSPPDESQTSQFSDIPSPNIASTLLSSTGTISQAESDSESDSDEEALPADAEEEHPPDSGQTQEQAVIRRTQLPSPAIGDEGSLFTVLKKNVGKDLAQVALPVSFNEPLTLLQRMAEEVEYFELLSQAVAATDPLERMCFIAAFVVSGYASTKHRSGRKGFNPMLAETFEDPRMHFIAEKVCHTPVVLAYHAEGDGWELYATSSGKTKFWGKSLEIIPQGSTHLVIGEDHYEWKKPSSFMRNLMMGTKYLEHVGKTAIHNLATGARCVLEFKEAGYFGPSNQVVGTVFSPDGKPLTHLEGKWDERMSQKLDEQHLRVLWRMTPYPRSTSEYYGFTSFGITLNEITPDLQGKLPPTDSRLRPDVRALEEGDIDLAEGEKVRVEELQRERRKQGEERKPRWFKKVGEEWEYVGGYWEQRAQGWAGIEPLW